MQYLYEAIGSPTFLAVLDLESGYHQLKIRNRDTYKTAFITKSGTYEYIQMPFGLINAPHAFHKFMNKVLKSFIYKFCLVYLDDIMIYSSTKELHYQHIELILQKLRTTRLRFNLSKYHFFKEKVKFLGLIVEDRKLRIPEEQIGVIRNIQFPRNKKHAKSLLGFLGFFRKFVPHFASLAKCITKMLKKNGEKHNNGNELNDFEKLKSEIIKANELFLPDFSKKFHVFTDASDKFIAGVLMQKHGNKLRPVLWISRKLEQRKIIYRVTEKELLAVVWILHKLKIYLGKNSF